MKKLLVLLIVFSSFINAQDFQWKKLNEGLYLYENSKPGELLKASDSVDVEIYIFKPEDEINLEKPINGRPTKYKTIYSKLSKGFYYDKELKFKKNSEYYLKQFNFKKTPKYLLNVNKLPEEKLEKIIDFIDKKYNVTLSQYTSSKNEKSEKIVQSIVIQPYNEIDLQLVKKEFPEDIVEIKTLNPNLTVYVYKITCK